MCLSLYLEVVSFGEIDLQTQHDIFKVALLVVAPVIVQPHTSAYILEIFIPITSISTYCRDLASSCLCTSLSD